MISEPYKDITKPVQQILDELIAPEDFYHQTHKRRIAKTLDLLLKEKPIGKLLELGTGKVIPLSLQQLAPKLDVEVTDFMLHLPATGESTLQIHNRERVCKTYRIDLEQTPIPVPDETYDVVLCTEVIEHMEMDPMFMMSEINRVLKPNGLLILTTPNVASSRGLYKILRGEEPYFYMQYRKKPALYRHNYEYSESSIRIITKSSGFSGSIWTEDTFEDGVTEDIERLRKLGYPLVSVGDNIFAVVRKTRGVLNRHPSPVYSD